MRKILFSLGAGIISLMLVKPVLCADLKIGSVDVIKAFNEYKKTKDYDKTLEDKRKAKEDERDKKVAELKKIQDQYVLLSDEEKKKKEDEINKKAQDLDQFNRQALADLRKDQNDYMLEITDEIEKTIQKLAKQEKFNLVLNSQGVLFSEGVTDLTDKVLEEINKSYKSK